MSMEPHQLRVVQEKLELDEKLQKLNTFRDSEAFKGLDIQEKWLLREQAQSMQSYSNVLAARIRLWNQKVDQ